MMMDETFIFISSFSSYIFHKFMVVMFPKVAEELRESVHKETGLTCSAGVAANRLLAKVLSDNTKDFHLLGCLFITFCIMRNSSFTCAYILFTVVYVSHLIRPSHVSIL